MSLMTLVRLISAIAVGWTLVAIGLGASGTRLPPPAAAEPPRAEAPPVDAMPTGWPKVEGYDLVDRASGRRSPIQLPKEQRWSIVSVSPWRGPGGELEAVGRWANPGGDGAFCGWGLFRLSDGAVLSRIAVDVLPSGRPCWVPGHPRTIVFPAGDGQLHRCRLAAEDEEPAIGERPAGAAGRPEPSRPVAWAVQPPGTGQVFLDDPVWPDDPRLKKWVFVVLRHQTLRHGRRVYGPSQLWWLELSDGAEMIVAAGRLTRSPGDDSACGGIEERFPNVAIGQHGDLRLVYLERPDRTSSWRLRSAVLDLHGPTGRPMVAAANTNAPESPEELHAAPLFVSADGATVYGMSQSGGLAVLSADCRGRAGRQPGRPASSSGPAAP